MFLLLIQGLIAGVIVGFVTGSIKSWVDRFFLVILLVSMMGLPIGRAITINLIVVGLAAVMMVLRQSDALLSVRHHWAMIVVSAVVGGVIGRLLGMAASASALLGVLGIYAILVGARLVLIKPVPERESKAHPAWLAPVAFAGGILAGFLSAGGKPFKVPVYNWALGHHPMRAYALAALGVSTAAWAAIGAQIAVGQSLSPADLLLAMYEFVIITLTALGVAKFWSPKLNKIVALIVAPILVLVGIRFLWIAWA
ncbi:MAG: sulfite exporter TauE/SafE family protein [Chloroflexi bacterium]|nr:MAG: sulfite exporter TauE/SafE family protein [Chloroflexota bacterium]